MDHWQATEVVVTRTVLAAPVTTVTVTVTPTPSALETLTLGRPWTTATPYIHTQFNRYKGANEVVESYPNQPSTAMSYSPCESQTGKIVGAFFGGFAGGILVVALVLSAVWLYRKRRGGAIQLRSSNGSVEDFLTPRSSAEDDQESLLNRSQEIKESNDSPQNNARQDSFLNAIDKHTEEV